MHGFDREYWQAHWQASVSGSAMPPNPYLASETDGLVPGTALDAGCGEGAEAWWLAAQGWRVTAVDISAEALSRARTQPAGRTAAEPIEWVEADLSVWAPDGSFDLVTTHYAHPAMPQLAFYRRIAEWMAPGGTLLIVGHLFSGPAHGHGSGHGHPPEEASVTAPAITAQLDAAEWGVVTATEGTRSVTDGTGRQTTLHDVVVRATRGGQR